MLTPEQMRCILWPTPGPYLQTQVGPTGEAVRVTLVPTKLQGAAWRTCPRTWRWAPEMSDSPLTTHVPSGGGRANAGFSGRRSVCWGPVCPQSQVQEREAGEGAGGQGKGGCDRNHKIRKCLPGPDPEVPGLHLHVRRGEVDKPGMNSEKTRERKQRRGDAERTREGGKPGEKPQAPSLARLRLPPPP